MPPVLRLPASIDTAVRHDQHGWTFEVRGVLFIMFFHLLYSRHADAPPPAHQTVTMTRQQLRTGKVSSRYGGYVCFHCLLNICATLNSRFTPHPCPPPFHPPASMSRIRVCTPVGLRSRFAAEVSQQSTSVGVYVVQPWVWMVMFFFLVSFVCWTDPLPASLLLLPSIRWPPSRDVSGPVAERPIKGVRYGV